MKRTMCFNSLHFAAIPAVPGCRPEQTNNRDSVTQWLDQSYPLSRPARHRPGTKRDCLHSQLGGQQSQDS